MVRVISVHHFTSQDVSSIPNPVASTIAGKFLLVSTENHQIQVHNLQKSTLLSHSFQTLDRAIELIYSPVGNYVVTLEGNRELEIYSRWFSMSPTISLLLMYFHKVFEKLNEFWRNCKQNEIQFCLEPRMQHLQFEPTVSRY